MYHKLICRKNQRSEDTRSRVGDDQAKSIQFDWIEWIGQVTVRTCVSVVRWHTKKPTNCNHLKKIIDFQNQNQSETHTLSSAFFSFSFFHSFFTSILSFFLLCILRIKRSIERTQWERQRAKKPKTIIIDNNTKMNRMRMENKKASKWCGFSGFVQTGFWPACTPPLNPLKSLSSVTSTYRILKMDVNANLKKNCWNRFYAEQICQISNFQFRKYDSFWGSFSLFGYQNATFWSSFTHI